METSLPCAVGSSAVAFSSSATSSESSSSSVTSSLRPPPIPTTTKFHNTRSTTRNSNSNIPNKLKLLQFTGICNDLNTGASNPVAAETTSSAGGGGGRSTEDNRSRTYTSYDIRFKLEAVKFAETHSGVATATAFGVDPKRIRDWKKQKGQLVVKCSSVIKYSSSPSNNRSTTATTVDGHRYASPSTPSNPIKMEPEDVEEDEEEPLIKPAILNILSSSPEDSESSEEEEEMVSEYEEPLPLLPPPPPVQQQFAPSDQPKKKREAFTLQQKLEVLKFLESHSVNATSRRYQVDPKSIRLWRSQKVKIEQTVQEELLALEQAADEDGGLITPRKRISGAGRKKRGQKSISLVELETEKKEKKEKVKEKWLPFDWESAVSGGNPEKVIVEIEENPNKRHRRSIKLSDKVEIIRLIENGQTQSDVARSLGISQSTVQTIWSNKPDILERNLTPKKKRKNLHWKKYSIIDTSLFNWYRQCRETGVPVDGKMLLDKATEFAEYYKQPDFKPQAFRWVDMFKKRHSISEVDRQDRIQAAASAAEQHHQIQQQQHHQQQHLPQQHHQHNMSQSHPSSSAHDLVPEFDLSSLPGIMAGLYPPDPTNPTGAPPPSAPPLPVPNFNPHIPIVPTMPVTTCDAMKYVELTRSWIVSTFGDNEEILNNHLNAIENAILKRRMTEMLAPVNPHSHR